MKNITDWESDMRKLGYTNQDIVNITLTILKAHDYGLKSRNLWERIKYSISLILKL